MKGGNIAGLVIAAIGAYLAYLIYRNNSGGAMTAAGTPAGSVVTTTNDQGAGGSGSGGGAGSGGGGGGNTNPCPNATDPYLDPCVIGARGAFGAQAACNQSGGRFVKTTIPPAFGYCVDQKTFDALTGGKGTATTSSGAVTTTNGYVAPSQYQTASGAIVTDTPRGYAEY
jgi:hypothetical protein